MGLIAKEYQHQYLNFTKHKLYSFDKAFFEPGRDMDTRKLATKIQRAKTNS